jgi:hypothetical protein
VQDLANIIPADEPVFLLRANDFCAPAAVAHWAAEVQKLPDHDPKIVEAAQQWAFEMVTWQRRHGSKTPDLPKPAAGSEQ